MKPALTLDKERILKFTAHAIVQLDEVCGVDFYNTDLRHITPRQRRDFVWAGQLHTAKALSRDQITKYMPTDIEGLMKWTDAVMEAVLEAVGTPEEAKSDGKRGEPAS
jgi:hypothetical protein